VSVSDFGGSSTTERTPDTKRNSAAIPGLKGAGVVVMANYNEVDVQAVARAVAEAAFGTRTEEYVPGRAGGGGSGSSATRSAS